MVWGLFTVVLCIDEILRKNQFSKVVNSLVKRRRKKVFVFFFRKFATKRLKKTEMNCDGIRGAMVDIINNSM